MRDYAGVLPVLLDADLYDSGWNGRLTPYPGITVQQVAMQSLRKSLMKKFQERTDAADAKALELFLKVNSTCKDFVFGAAPITEAEWQSIGEAKEFLYRACFKPDPAFKRDGGEKDDVSYDMCILNTSAITDGFAVGNGANIGSYGTDFLSKMGTSTMAATDRALQLLYMQAVSEDTIWSDVESIRSVHRGFEIVRGSRLSFVPKTTEISRTICTEPLVNMMFQQGVKHVLEKALRETCGISLSKQQPKNRELARLGSKSGRFGTIDLSSASDSMSLSLVRAMFPSTVVSWLMKTRSPVTILPDGTEVELHMVSSMGNAFTFPLQTLFFCSLVYGAYRTLDIPFERPFRQSLGNFAVYGDDIIVDHRAYDLVVRLLSLSGFSVNVNKSFNETLFRESCGADYYQGRDVRGVYIQSLNDVCDRYSAINRLNIWSAKHWIPLPNLIQYLMAGTRFLPVPFTEQDIAGIKVHSTHLRTYSRSRYTGGLLYRYVSTKELEFSVTDVERRPPKIRGWVNNPAAVLLAALAGTLRSGKVVTRSSRRSTRIKRRYSSSWDYIPSDQALWPGFGDDWKVIIELNLNIS